MNGPGSGGGMGWRPAGRAVWLLTVLVAFGALALALVGPFAFPPDGGQTARAADIIDPATLRLLDDRTRVTLASFRVNRATQTYLGTATVANTSTERLAAPLYLVVAAVSPAGTSVVGATGLTVAGQSYYDLTALLPGGALAAGATSSPLTLQMKNPTAAPIQLDLHVYGANTPPVANAGPDQTARAGDTVTLDGGGSTDGDGDPLSYDWSLPAVPPGSVATLSGSTTVHPTLHLDKPGAYVAQLVVDDGPAASVPDTVTVSTENSRPVAHAGPDRSAPVDATATLDGSRSSDVDGDALTFAWTLLTRPDGSSAELANAATVNPRLTLDQAGAYTVQLLVNDRTADSAPATVTISTGNSRPVAEAGPAQTVAVGASVRLNGDGSHDANGDPLTYRWALIAAPVGSGATLAHPAAAAPSFVADKAGTYVAQLIVHDGTADSAPDTVTLSTGNSRPVADAGPDQAAAVGETVALDGSASRDADGDVLSYRWALTTRPAGSTAAPSAPDREQVDFVPDRAGPYIAQLIVGDGTLTSAPDTAVVTVTVPEPVNRDPRITSSPATTATVGQPYSYDANATDDDGDALSYALNAAPAGMSIDASSGLIAWTPPTAGTVAVGVTVDDGHGGTATQSFAIVVEAQAGPTPPPDPVTVAPPVDPTVPTTTHAATEFLYTGSNPIQTGVAPGTIEEKRAAVIRGKVLDRAGSPLPGVTLTILNHPEFGQTVSRADGAFDLAVNGGGYLTVNYQRSGYLPAQRQVQTPWQDYAFAPDVSLVTLDPAATAVDLTAPAGIQVARGTPSTDGDGTRQATLLFPAGTTATMVRADGTTQPLPNLTVRATEYTIGPDGPKAMPAPLPPTSGYTYAVEISADEALAAGATSVTLNQPIPFYVENFLRIPVHSAAHSSGDSASGSSWIRPPLPVGIRPPVPGDWAGPTARGGAGG